MTINEIKQELNASRAVVNYDGTYALVWDYLTDEEWHTIWRTAETLGTMTEYSGPRKTYRTHKGQLLRAASMSLQVG